MTDNKTGSRRELLYYAHRLRPDSNTINLYGIGDIHIGNPYTSLTHFKKLCNEIIQNPNAYCILNGDLAECVTRDSKGDIWEQKMTPAEQISVLTELLMPLKGRVLGCTRGNHEDRIYRLTSIDICRDIAEKLQCPYEPEGIFLKISFGRQRPGGKSDQPYTFWVYATHGWGGARRIGSKVIKIEDLGASVHSDIYFIGHDHIEHFHPQNYLIPDPHTRLRGSWMTGLVKNHRKVFVGCGAWVKWGGYAQRRGYQPTDLGTPKVIVTGHRSNAAVDLRINVEF